MRSSLLRRYPVISYLLFTFLISWSGALLVALPELAHGQQISITTGILLFPVMLLGPSVSGILLAWLVDGRDGLRDFLASERKWRIAPQWYTLLLLPPVLVLAVLYFLKAAVSPAFLPNNFYIGVAFGIPAGIFEEIGWTGYLYLKMKSGKSPLVSAILLGAIWSLWHLPVINFLGAAVPHGIYWWHFFLAFAFVMTAMRVLICWQYLNSGSVLLAQLMHISSTGTLVVFSPTVGPAREAMWYAIYGCPLWAVVAIVVANEGRELHKPLQQSL